MWIPCDSSLLTEALNAKERAAVEAIRANEETDFLLGICAGIAARIRAAVLANGRAKLQGAAGFIPQALRNEAVAILRLKTLTRYALAVSEERKAEAREAEERLDAIAKGELPFLDEEAADQSAPAPTYKARPSRWNSPASGGIM